MVIELALEKILTASKNWVVTAIDYNRTKEDKGIAINPTSASHDVTEPEPAALNNSNSKDSTLSSEKQDGEDVFSENSELGALRDKQLSERGKKIADKNWILMAYDETSADSSTSAITATNQGQAAPTTDVTVGKGTTKPAEKQEGGVESLADGVVVLKKPEMLFDNEYQQIERMNKKRLIREELKERGVSDAEITKLETDDSSDLSFRDAPSAIGDEAEVARALDVMEAEGVEVVRSLDEIPNDHEAYRAITDGRNITGCYDPKTGKVYLYAPWIKSMSDLMRTMRHEGVAHMGLRELLGRKDFGDLCDKVWRELMTAGERKAMIAYLMKMSVDKFERLPLEAQAEVVADRRGQRAAADEFMAFMGEDGSYENVGMWERFVSVVRDVLRDLLRKLGLNLKITKADVRRLLRRSEAAKYGAGGITDKISGSQGGISSGKELPLQGKNPNNNGRQETDTAERVEDGWSGYDGRGVASRDAAQRMVAARDRSDIRVFEEELASSHREHSERSERDRREAESERLVKVSKDNGLYRSSEDLDALAPSHSLLMSKLPAIFTMFATITFEFSTKC